MEGQFFLGIVAAVVIGGMVWYIRKRKKEADAIRRAGGGGYVGSGSGSGSGKTQKK